ncbi:MAG: hypothetical protein HUU20_07105 [Pirellulales bacterium]|nr:hypothetical protein [Pirellulales bacterium]
MTRIIQELPYFGQPTSAPVRGQSFPVKREQIIVWVSVADPGQGQLDPRTPRIPAILDTGCNHNFVINQQHLTDWAGIHPDYLPKLAGTRVAGEPVSQFAANVWLHPNVPGKRDEPTSGPPFQLELAPGIAVHPAAQGEPVHPRLPLLGLRAFQRAGLRIAIDCGRRRVNIRTRRRLWLFG